MQKFTKALPFQNTHKHTRLCTPASAPALQCLRSSRVATTQNRHRSQPRRHTPTPVTFHFLTFPFAEVQILRRCRPSGIRLCTQNRYHLPESCSFVQSRTRVDNVQSVSNGGLSLYRDPDLFLPSFLDFMKLYVRHR